MQILNPLSYQLSHTQDEKQSASQNRIANDINPIRVHDPFKFHKAKAPSTVSRKAELNSVKLRHKNVDSNETNVSLSILRMPEPLPDPMFTIINDLRSGINDKAANPLGEAEHFTDKRESISQNAERLCLHPEYLVYTWVLSLIALATTLKLYFLVKTMLAVIMVMAYASCILIFYSNVFVAGKFSHE